MTFAFTLYASDRYYVQLKRVSFCLSAFSGLALILEHSARLLCTHAVANFRAATLSLRPNTSRSEPVISPHAAAWALREPDAAMPFEKKLIFCGGSNEAAVFFAQMMLI